MASSLEPAHAPFDEPSLALIGWPNIPASGHSITSLAVDLDLGLLATGTTAGWLYLWNLASTSECRGEVAPRVACVAEWLGAASVLFCHFCRWCNPGLFGINFNRVLVSLHEDGILRIWTVDDGRCLFALPTAAYLGVNAFLAAALSDSRYILLGGKCVLVIFDLWSRSPAISLLFSPTGGDGSPICIRTLPLTALVGAVSDECLLRSFPLDYLRNPSTDHHVTALSPTPQSTVTVISVAVNSSTTYNGPTTPAPHRTIVSASLSDGTLLTWDVTLALSRWDRKAVYQEFTPPLGRVPKPIASQPRGEVKLENSPQLKRTASSRVEDGVGSNQGSNRTEVIFPEEFIPENSVIVVAPLSITIPELDEWSAQASF